jgi:hypothetical protein
MRFAVVSLILLAATPALTSSWFANDEPEPKAWTNEQIEKAQVAFNNVKDDAFTTWTESQLRQFLMDQGVIEPKGTKEQLTQMVRNQYVKPFVCPTYLLIFSYRRKAFSSALSSMSASASTAVHGDSYHQATKSASLTASKSASSASNRASASVSSAATAATAAVRDAMDDTKDYIYSTWSDNQLRSYLEEKGIIRTEAQVSRDEMLAKMNSAYASAADPIYSAWSDSYIRNWLIKNKVIAEPPAAREKLIAAMESYYYDTKVCFHFDWLLRFPC